jgi:hypothetical protein
MRRFRGAILSLAFLSMPAITGAAEKAGEVKVILHDPVIVSQAPEDVKGWGPWQFPMIERLEDGRLMVEFNRGADSATAYGLPMGQAVSSDDGATWSEVPSPGVVTGLRLPNGDLLRAFQRKSPSVAGVNLPRPLASIPGSYKGITYTYYRRAELTDSLRAGWFFLRRPSGSAAWAEEQARVEIPNDFAYASENVFVYPFFEHDRIQVSPDGRLVATLYGFPQTVNDWIVVRRFLAMFLESPDNGKTWRLKGSFPYHPDMSVDKEWDSRDGFTEPQVGYLPDGSLLCLLRTTDGNGVGPLYSSRSRDGGATWSEPRVFDDLGVWPQVLTLKNGVTLVSYGRPGLYVRAAKDPAALQWGKRVTVVTPGELGTETCSYSDLFALSDHEALIAFSDFTFSDKQGHPRKTILVRKIEVK